MELYYAVSGSGAVLHTLNPRLHPDQVVWIADNAEDQIIFFDLTFLPLIEIIAQLVVGSREVLRRPRPEASAPADDTKEPSHPKLGPFCLYEWNPARLSECCR